MPNAVQMVPTTGVHKVGIPTLTLSDLFKNVNFSKPSCVVVGRHQNPWLECSVRNLDQEKVDLARRISGGGTVYHDLGNLNFSIITDRNIYNRKLNLQLLVDALKSCGESRELSITEQFDVLLEGQKISGTAARLDKGSAMHHFTCLVDSDVEMMDKCLTPTFRGKEIAFSRATSSRLAKVTNTKNYNSV